MIAWAALVVALLAWLLIATVIVTGLRIWSKLRPTLSGLAPMLAMFDTTGLPVPGGFTAGGLIDVETVSYGCSAPSCVLERNHSGDHMTKHEVGWADPENPDRLQ